MDTSDYNFPFSRGPVRRGPLRVREETLDKLKAIQEEYRLTLVDSVEVCVAAFLSLPAAERRKHVAALPAPMTRRGKSKP